MSGSGGTDVIRAINQASRRASAYRAERSERRKGLRYGHDYALAGESHACARCNAIFDVNGLLRDRGEWTWEACSFEIEADTELARASEPTAMLAASGATLTGVVAFQMAMLLIETRLFVEAGRSVA